jgi:hypothetical protein
MDTLARGLGLAIAVTLLAACPAVAPLTSPAPEPSEDVPPPLARDPVLRVHHHWAECHEGIFGDLTVTIDGAPCQLGPGELLTVPLTPGPHEVALSPDRTPGRAVPDDGPEVEPLAIPTGRDHDLHVGCRPHALHRGYLVPLILRPDGPAGFVGRIAAGGVEVEVVAGQRTVLLLPRGTHRLEPRPPAGCPVAATSVTLSGAGALVHLGPCGEARATPQPALVPAPRRCDFAPGSVGSAP